MLRHLVVSLSIPSALVLLGLPACTKTEASPASATPDSAEPPAPPPATGAAAHPDKGKAPDAAHPHAGAARQRVAGAGLSTPESVLYDPGQDLYLVSNIQGSPLAQDDNGFVSRISPEGKVVDLKWIDGARPEVTLHAPKGLAIARGMLWVADIDHVRRFDLDSGAPKGAIAIEGATFLNDLVADDDGVVYVSDSGLAMGPKGFGPSGTDAVYRIDRSDAVTPLARGEALGHPNGLALADGRLWVVTFGSGEIYSLDPATPGPRRDARRLPAGSLDGIVRAPDGRLLVSSWEASAVFAGTAKGAFEKVLGDLPAPADIGLDPKRGRLLVPLFKESALVFVPLP